jgi:outer membrane immunogenic protein
MIRRIVLASAGALALAGTAFAADLAPPPPVVLPPPPLWTGFYAGVNAGYEWAASRSLATTAVPGPCVGPAGGCVLAPNYSITSALASTFSPQINPSGFIGGGQIGYNYQFANSWVVGIEADIQGIAGASRNFSFASTTNNPNSLAFPINQFATVTKSLNYLGTVRGRLGWLLTPTLLIYGDGGLAYGGINSDTGITQTVFATPTLVPGFAVGRASSTQVGWTAGGGVEWMFLPNWSAKVEYAYYDLGSVSYRLNPLVIAGTGLGLTPPGAPFSTSYARTSTRFNGNIVRAGINYHFNWGAPAPIVAKY